MILNTRHFGEITVDESKIINFTEPLPGFPDCGSYILLQEESNVNQEEGCLFWWLQGIDRPDVAFVLIDVIMVMPDYNPMIDADAISDLGEYDPEAFLVYNIANIPENIKKMSVNLKAPIVINSVLQKGKQVVVNNEEYTVKHYIFDEISKK